jgi:hypothetical protein
VRSPEGRITLLSTDESDEDDDSDEPELLGGEYDIVSDAAQFQADCLLH